MRLSLDDCLKMALANNLDLVLVRKDPAIAEQNVESQQAAFDPLDQRWGDLPRVGQRGLQPLGHQSEHVDLRQHRGSPSSSASAATTVANFSMAQFDSSGPLFSFESGYSAGLDMTFNMPLLRGFGRTETTEQLQLARNNLEISREDLRRQAHQTLEIGRIGLLGSRRRRPGAGGGPGVPRPGQGPAGPQSQEGRGRHAGADRDHPGRGRRRLAGRGRHRRRGPSCSMPRTSSGACSPCRRATRCGTARSRRPTSRPSRRFEIDLDAVLARGVVLPTRSSSTPARRWPTTS